MGGRGSARARTQRGDGGGTLRPRKKKNKGAGRPVVRRSSGRAALGFSLLLAGRSFSAFA